MNSVHRLLAWYGDDFTGSTDVLESLAARGIDAVLFLERPSDVLFAKFGNYRAFGLAGSSRSQTPEWMSRELPVAFQWLRSLGTAVCHYKVCSTFDSSPQTGSIGRALEIGREVFPGRFVPIVVGAPALRRYMVFGNLFAAAAGATHRIDRHPTMSRHPVTPMHEGDLRLHLARQTRIAIDLVDILDLQLPDAAERLSEKLARDPDAVFFDVLDEASLVKVGALLWDPAFRQPFIVGSSGVEYALTASWGARLSSRFSCKPADRMVVLSGSCSPVTASQILHAGENGFQLIRINLDSLNAQGLDATVRNALEALNTGHSVVIYSAEGPSDVREAGIEFRNALGEHSGRILRAVLDQCDVRRVIVAGGDTSSHAGRQLGIQALTFVCPLAPGAPLCKAWSDFPHRSGIEIVLKGGQCGGPDFFSTVLRGTE